MNRPEINAPRRRFLKQSATLAAVGILGQSAANPRQSAAQATADSATTESTPWTLGCFTRPFSAFSYADTVNAIADGGYSAIGLMSLRLSSGTVSLADASPAQVDEIRDRATERNLSIVATYYDGPPLGIPGNPGDSITLATQTMRGVIDRCHDATCGTILMGGTGDANLLDAYYKVVRSVCDYAAEKNVALVLKPHGGLNATGDQLRSIVGLVDHPAFRVWYDPGNVFYYSKGELDPLDDVAAVDGLVTGMCVKDFEPPQSVELNPGTGRVDFAALMKRLAAGGFRGGPLVVETLAPGDLKATAANGTATRKFLERLLG
jgi:sugar phosphate isomerase/epimerase